MARSSRLFTEFTVRALKPRAQRYDVREPGGLAARVFPDGRVSWCLIYIDQAGRKRRVTLGRYGDGSNGTLTLKDARAARDVARVAINQGRDPVQERRQERRAARQAYEQAQRELTVEAFFPYFLRYLDPPKDADGDASQRRHRRGERTRREYRRRVRKHLVENPAVRRLKLKDVTRANLVRVLDAFEHPQEDKKTGKVTPPRPVERNRVLESMKLFFRVAVERGEIDQSPAAMIRHEEEQHDNSRVLTDAEIPVFWQSLDTTNLGASSTQCLKFTLLTGQRISETSQTPWVEIDLVSGVWYLSIARMKQTRWTRQLIEQGIKHHVLRLPSLALDILNERRAVYPESRYVFPSPLLGMGDRAVHANTITVTLNRAFASGQLQSIEPCTPHALRRTCRTGMEKIGVDPAVSERVLMHAPAVMSRTYNKHRYQAEMGDALARWADHIEQLLRGEAPGDGKVVRIR